jgi:hypothetical protein
MEGFSWGLVLAVALGVIIGQLIMLGIRAIR